jgi:hypothetical protein
MAAEISAAQLIVTLKPAKHKNSLVGNKFFATFVVDVAQM